MPRLFIALNLPADLRRELHDSTRVLREAAPGSWVRADNLHLTVKFLGERPGTDIAPLRQVLERVTAGSSAARLVLGGVGAFPNLRRARTVWIGMEQDPKLELLHNDVETACAGLGYELEGRSFRPHVTLGRLRDPAQQELRALVRAARRVTYSRTIEVSTLDLMQSDLGPQGSRYTCLASLPLGAR